LRRQYSSPLTVRARLRLRKCSRARVGGGLRGWPRLLPRNFRRHPL